MSARCRDMRETVTYPVDVPRKNIQFSAAWPTKVALGTGWLYRYVYALCFAAARPMMCRAQMISDSPVAT